jgi:hypothetical protein
MKFYGRDAGTRRKTLMAIVEFSYSPANAAYFLDVSPMISALRFQPDDFEYAHGWLRHVPSRHRFRFHRSGQVSIDAKCRCSGMSIRPEQSEELAAMFMTWRQDYWLPLETNREFASHFMRPNAWGRLLRDIRMAFRRLLRREAPSSVPVGTVAAAARAD